MNDVPGVDMSSGSLGQGISAAVGMALSAKLSESEPPGWPDFALYTAVTMPLRTSLAVFFNGRSKRIIRGEYGKGYY